MYIIKPCSSRKTKGGGRNQRARKNGRRDGMVEFFKHIGAEIAELIQREIRIDELYFE
jgi:hypothetical protein